MKLAAAAILTCALAACASMPKDEPMVVAKPKTRIAKASILPERAIPAERDGIRAEDTGAIMWVCGGSAKHEDKEVFISTCPSCSEHNYFFWNHADGGFVCFACTKAVDDAQVKCPECGKTPRRVRTRPIPKSAY